MDEPRRILEFYSGIGGMRYSLIKAGIRGEVIEAFDINDRANDVYQHNFAHRPFQGNIQTLTAVKLDEYDAHAWLLSPPCQPYTRQGLRKDSADARAFSFLKILELIPHMLHPPLMLFVENVVGFEISNTHEQMMQILSENGFVTQEYILSPLQFGIPYSRPRYFCLAKREPLTFQNPSYNNQLLWSPLFLLKSGILAGPLGCLDDRKEESSIFCEPIRNFLETHLSHENIVSAPDLLDDICDASTEGCGPENTEKAYCSSKQYGMKDGEVCTKATALTEYIVPLSLIERWGSAMDIVYPYSMRCCCFTKSYFRYVKGTGSLLATTEISNSGSSKLIEGSFLNELGLRYFTPREVANLHSFPEDFHFPPHISIRQQYALLGNSMSITVVSPLLRYLFAEPT